jgi:hypothetical protein
MCKNKDIDSEMLGDKIRMIMINEIELIEEIIIKSETSYEYYQNMYRKD